VVEMREVVGGACINTGTIPSKTMREAVLHLSGYNYKSIYGMNYRVKEKITMSDLAFRVQHVIKTEVDVTRRSSRATTWRCWWDCQLRGREPHTGDQFAREQCLPDRECADLHRDQAAVSDKVPINGRTIINSDQVLDLPDLPKTLIVVGGA